MSSRSLEGLEKISEMAGAVLFLAGEGSRALRRCPLLAGLSCICASLAARMARLPTRQSGNLFRGSLRRVFGLFLANAEHDGFQKPFLYFQIPASVEDQPVAGLGGIFRRDRLQLIPLYSKGFE